MTNVNRIYKMINENGRPVRVIVNGGGIRVEYSYRAFIKPLMYKNKMYLDNEFTTAGEIDEACYLYIGPPEYRLDEMPRDTYIKCGDSSFNIVRPEAIFWKDNPVYVRAIIRQVISGGYHV